MSELERLRDEIGALDRAVLEALCDVLDLEPGDLFERAQRRARKAKP